MCTRAVYDRFVDGFAALTRQYVLDDPLDEKTTLGPMAATRFADVVRKQTAEAVSKGARALIDARAFKRDKAGTPWLAPQVLTDVDHTMSVMMEESFGPVVGIMKVKDDDEAVRLMNDSPLRPHCVDLDARTWRPPNASARGIETGTVYMNRCDYLDPGLGLDGRQGYRPRRIALAHRLRDADPAQELPSAPNLKSLPCKCRMSRARRHPGDISA